MVPADLDRRDVEVLREVDLETGKDDVDGRFGRGDGNFRLCRRRGQVDDCLLYTSDAADEL